MRARDCRSGGDKEVIEGAWRWHRSWRVGRPKLGLASKAVRKGVVCELTGTIEGKEVARRRLGDRVLYSPSSGEGDAMPDREERSRMRFGRPLHR
jgi:hypothetical protein